MYTKAEIQVPNAKTKQNSKEGQELHGHGGGIECQFDMQFGDFLSLPTIPHHRTLLSVLDPPSRLASRDHRVQEYEIQYSIHYAPSQPAT